MALIHSDKGLEFLNLIRYPEINIKENTFTFISGLSGCGKSTYLKMLNRMALPTHGKIYYNGKDIQQYSVLPYRKSLLLVPQEVFLLDSTIEENFKFYYNAREENLISSDKISELLKICCIDFTPDTDCTKLSGGERQRVFLAIFLSFATEVLLLDEPTAALDEATSVLLLTNIREYCKAKSITAICVCHNNALIKMFSQEVIRLGD